MCYYLDGKSDSLLLFTLQIIWNWNLTVTLTETMLVDVAFAKSTNESQVQYLYLSIVAAEGRSRVDYTMANTD